VDTGSRQDDASKNVPYALCVPFTTAAVVVMGCRVANRAIENSTNRLLQFFVTRKWCAALLAAATGPRRSWLLPGERRFAVKPTSQAIRVIS